MLESILFLDIFDSKLLYFFYVKKSFLAKESTWREDRIQFLTSSLHRRGGANQI